MIFILLLPLILILILIIIIVIVIVIVIVIITIIIIISISISIIIIIVILSMISINIICGPALHGSCFGGEHFAYIIAITIHPRQPHPRHHSNNPMIVPHPHPPLHHDPPHHHHYLLLHQDPVRKECFLCAVLLVTYDHNGIPLFPRVCCQVIANTISMNVGRFISKLLLRTPDAPRTQSGACISIGVHFLLQAYG